jgi:Tol biopolymer transport system component
VSRGGNRSGIERPLPEESGKTADKDAGADRMNHDIVSREGSISGRTLNGGRSLISSAWLLAAVGLLAGCASAPRIGQPADPGAASGSEAATTATSPSVLLAASPVAVEPADSVVGDLAVRPGEACIAGQRLVDLDNPSDGHGVYLVRPDGTGDHQLVPELDGSQMHPAWSPDGEELAFIHEGLDGMKELWVVGADGTGAHQVTRCERPCNNMISPDWSPADPRSIYVGRDEGPSKFMLSRFDLDTKEIADVIVREDGRTAETWRLSPDGTQVLFIRDILTDAKRAAIFVADLATGEERQLTPYDFSLDRPDWLPDGRIVFNSPSLGVYNDSDAAPANLWTMDADGGNLEQLTHYTEDNSGATQPHVLEDGSGIVFTKVLDGTLLRPMAVVDLDGRNERYLTPERHRGSHIDVRPMP